MNYTSINKRIFTSVTSCSKPAIRIKKKKKMDKWIQFQI